VAIAIGVAVWGGISTSTGNYETTINPTPPGGSILGGCCIGIVQSGAVTDLVTSAQYGTGGTVVPLSRAASPYGFAAESTEPGAVYFYWAGDSAVFPTGSQVVRIVRTGSTRMRAVIWSLYVATGMQVQLDNGATGSHVGIANPSWSHSSLANNVVAFLAIHSGLNTMTTTQAAGWTKAVGNTTSEDATATGTGWAERTLATAGALAPGWTAATAEDFVGASISFKEGAPPPAGTDYRRYRRQPSFIPIDHSYRFRRDPHRRLFVPEGRVA
jgi:hypothetical protein